MSWSKKSCFVIHASEPEPRSFCETEWGPYIITSISIHDGNENDDVTN